MKSYVRSSVYRRAPPFSRGGVGKERVIRKLVLENEPLVERMLGRLESFKKTLAGKGEKYSAAEKARIDKALKLYLKAAEASGKTRLAGRIRAMLKEEEDTTAENEHLSTLSAENRQKEPLTNINQENMHVSGGEIRYSIKHPTFTDKDIQHNIEDLAEMKEIAIIDAAALDKTGKSPKTMFEEYFQSLGNSIYSPVYGDIAVGKSSVKSEIRHGITANKIASMSAIPEVIEKGKVIFFENKTSGDERVKRIVIAAPIKIQNDPYYMGVMLQRDPSTQYLYLHNVAIEKEMTESTRAHLVTTGADEHNEHLSITSILQKAINVKLEKKKINGNTKFSRKTDQHRSTLTKGEAQKQKANYESDKVYTKTEIAKMVESLNGLPSIPKRFRTDIVNDI